MAPKLDSKTKAIAKLTAMKNILIEQITALYEEGTQIDVNLSSSSAAQYFLVRAEECESLRKDFKRYIFELFDLRLQIEPESEFCSGELKGFDDMYFQIKLVQQKLNPSVGSLMAPSPNREVENLSRRETRPRLPKLELFVFDGNIENFKTFYETFCSLVHNQPDILCIDKFHYLLSCTSGAAQNIVKSVPMTADNYPVVWQSILDRYMDNRVLAGRYLEKMLNFSPLTKESSSNLNNFIETFEHSFKAIQALKLKDLSSFMLCHIALRALDSQTRKMFEQSIDQKSIPSLTELITFVHNQIKVLDHSSSFTSTNKTTNYSPVSKNNFENKNTFNKNKSSTSGTKNVFSHTTQSRPATKKIICANCNENHMIYRCNQFRKLTVEQRISRADELNLCKNCLKNHGNSNTCDSQFLCGLCHLPHHILLHKDKMTHPPNYHADSPAAVVNSSRSTHAMDMSQPITATHSQSSNSSSNIYHASTQNENNYSVLLGTALVTVLDAYGKYQLCRALIDSGAQNNFISSECLSRLGLQTRNCNFNVFGINNESVQTKGMTSCVVQSRHCAEPVFHIDAVVLSKITSDLPTVEIPACIKNKYDNLRLADPLFYEKSPIDIILAGDVFPHIYNGEKIILGEDIPPALSSVFGYVITGKLGCVPSTTTNYTSVASTFHLVSYTNDDLINNYLKRFWEIESSPCETLLNPLDVAAEKMFNENHYRNSTGRYVSPLLRNPDAECIGESYQCALKRFLQQERRLSRTPELHKAYIEFMREYESLGHMEVYKGTETSKYLIPHHAVYRPSSLTTPVRVVFDGSAKSSNGVCLNSTLFSGPSLHHDILKIILNFRKYDVCFTADVTKMYRQILIDPKERIYQHILWRETPAEPIRIYELSSVTYGLRSSPYIAIRTLQQLAHDEQTDFPHASSVLLQGFFVDDLLWSTQTLEEACTLQDELVSLLKRGGFELRKWASNSSELLNRVQSDQTISINFQDDTLSSAIKILGLTWLPSQDCFSFNYNLIDNDYTKRSVLRLLASIYDPVGFISPCTFIAKCIMQDLWKLSLGWDEPLPIEIRDKWGKFVSALPSLSDLRIERHVLIPNFVQAELIAYCDASSLGYSCCVYIRSVDSDGNLKVRLLASKTKINPLKSITIPKAELMAAVLLSKLVRFVCANLNDLHLKITAFSDSSVVLSWLQTPPYKLKTFVSNRVAQIIDIVPPNLWYHVRSQDNAADICSRGEMPEQFLANSSAWFQGPQWLYEEREHWPVSTFFVKDSEKVPEMKTNVDTFNLTAKKDDGPSNDLENGFNKISSFKKLQRIMAWCHRFIKNAKSKKEERLMGPLTTPELKLGHDSIIRCVQENHFQSEIDLLKSDKYVASLRKLSPFIDSAGYIRVGGRISQSDLPYNTKHPVLLPKKCHVTHLLIEYLHKVYLHAGPRTLQGILCKQYWIVSARSSIRSILSKCVTCFKSKPSQVQPLMGSLPSTRLKPDKVFNHVGCDLGGPFLIKESLRRNAKVNKAYLCLFVCFSVKAVHLEIVTQLSAECFLAAFDRFVARRGLCSCLYSDCGTNFVAASKYLTEINEFYRDQKIYDEVLVGLASKQVEWRFNPPSSPSMGGLWEAGIKQAKHFAMKSSDRAQTYEELSTLFCKVEAIMNSRPICSLSDNPNEFEALTPGHFLIGQSLMAVPEYNLNDLNINRLTRWEFVQRASQSFWKNWSNDYIHTLQQRTKWFTTSPNLKVGTLVMIKTDMTRPLLWPLGRIECLHPGADNVVRVVTVRTKNGFFKRPVNKLCPLPNQD